MLFEVNASPCLLNATLKHHISQYEEDPGLAEILLFCSSCIAKCIRHRFLITPFLAEKPWARISLQTGGSPSALFFHLCVTFHKCVIVAFYG